MVIFAKYHNPRCSEYIQKNRPNDVLKIKKPYILESRWNKLNWENYKNRVLGVFKRIFYESITCTQVQKLPSILYQVFPRTVLMVQITASNKFSKLQPLRFFFVPHPVLRLLWSFALYIYLSHEFCIFPRLNFFFIFQDNGYSSPNPFNFLVIFF